MHKFTLCVKMIAFLKLNMSLLVCMFVCLSRPTASVGKHTRHGLFVFFLHCLSLNAAPIISILHCHSVSFSELFKCAEFQVKACPCAGMCV